MTSPGELVVLLDGEHRPIGTMSKAAVHGRETPLHLAFSFHLFDGQGRTLVTRRALAKRTWPGVWTNTCCGHPAPGESMEAAVRRRLSVELGLSVGQLTCELEDFVYRATDAGGVVENEFCPVFSGRLAAGHAEVRPDPGEVAEYAWIDWGDLTAAVVSAPFAFSPWSVLQLNQLRQAGFRPDRSDA